MLQNITDDGVGWLALAGSAVSHTYIYKICSYVKDTHSSTALLSEITFFDTYCIASSLPHPICPRWVPWWFNNSLAMRKDKVHLSPRWSLAASKVFTIILKAHGIRWGCSCWKTRWNDDPYLNIHPESTNWSTDAWRWMVVQEYQFKKTQSEVLPKRTMSRKGSPSSKMPSRKWHVSGQILKSIQEKRFVRFKGNKIWSILSFSETISLQTNNLDMTAFCPDFCSAGRAKSGCLYRRRRLDSCSLVKQCCSSLTRPVWVGEIAFRGLNCEDGISWTEAMILSRFLMLWKMPLIDLVDAQEKLRHGRTGFCTEVLNFWKRMERYVLGEDLGKEIIILFYLFNSSCSLRSGITIHYVHEMPIEFFIWCWSINMSIQGHSLIEVYSHACTLWSS